MIPGTHIIFLDFDGVIQTLRGCIASGKSFSKAPSDPVLVELLRRACEAGARIVVSSTWRELGRMALDKLEENGLADYLMTDWKTPIIELRDYVAARPAEIADWLSRHPECKSYLILDDDEWKWTDEQREQWVKCCSRDGINHKGLLRISAWAGLEKRVSDDQTTYKFDLAISALVKV